MRNSCCAIGFSILAHAVWAQPASGGMPPLPGGDPGLVGAAAAPIGQLSTPLKYRDPSQPLTVGEMSKLQAKKLEDDFLMRLGYTSVVPARAVTQRTAPPKPTTQLVALGIYGPVNALQADVVWAGRVTPVKSGQILASGVTVQRIEGGAVVLSIQRGKGDKASVRQVSVAAGEALELEN